MSKAHSLLDERAIGNLGKMRVKAYAIKLQEQRLSELCCAWEIALELQDEDSLPLSEYIDNLLSHKEDCKCLEIVAAELSAILYQNRLDLYCV